MSNQVIAQLKILKRSNNSSGSKLDKDNVKALFKPIWKLWESLKKVNHLTEKKRWHNKRHTCKYINYSLFRIKNINSSELRKKYSDDDKSPVKSFIILEKISSIKLVTSIDENLKSIHGFITGTMLLSEEIKRLVSQLMEHQTPGSWQDQWEGPEDPLVYLTAIVERFRALDKWVISADSTSKFFEQELDLSELFRPDVFLNSLRQHAAREAKTSMDGLRLVCSFSGPMKGVSLNVRITGLQLEGCSFDGVKLSECQENSPSIVSLPPCFIGWIQKVSYTTSNSFFF